MDLLESRYNFRNKIKEAAIIGIGCRFPGEVNNPESFWELLINKKNAISDIPSSRWDLNAFYHEQPGTPGKMYCKQAGTINNVQGFDADFFDISPREAIGIDPQQRLLLEVVWEALEDAGISPTKIKSQNVGVYVGLGSDDYSFHLMSGDNVDCITAYNCLGTNRGVAAGRISYALGLHGPAIQVDTACSSSLMALHLAHEDLNSGKISMAIVAGVNLILSPHTSIGCSQLRALSPSGQCNTFDASANGYVRGEGVGAVILKTNIDAKENCDNTYAVLKGSSVNHDGRSNGLTAPNCVAQERLLVEALNNAGVAAEDVTFIEAHGTGTPLGDPIELEAIGKAYQHESREPLYLGALKTNIGHLEAASGIASIIKTALILKHGKVPSNLNFSTPSPYVDWQKLPVTIPLCTELLPKGISGKSYAGVSSFGLSGTNVHFILGQSEQEAKPDKTNGVDESHYLVTLSAKSPAALKALKTSYIEYFHKYKSIDFEALSYTSQQSRSCLAYKQAFVASSLNDFTREVTQLNHEIIVKSREIQPRIAFIFAGQGSQYAGMGRELYKHNTVFKEKVDECETFLLPFLKQPLKEIMWGSLTHLLDQTEYTQPCLFTFEYALASVWKSIGITPNIAIGHSLGEIVAATMAGIFNLKDALKIVFARSQLMTKKTAKGAMAAIIGDRHKIETLLKTSNLGVEIAAYNSPRNTVVSGDISSITLFIEQAKSHSLKCQLLPVSHAFHSKHMEPMLENFDAVMKRINFSKPAFNIISTLDENNKTSNLCQPEYWCKQLRQPVRFLQSIEVLAKEQIDVVIEIGTSSLLALLKTSLLANDSTLIAPGIKKNNQEYSSFLTSAGALFETGADITWDGLWSGKKPTKIKIPTYPFQRINYWQEPSKSKSIVNIMEEEITKISQLSEQELDEVIGKQLALGEVK